MPGKQALRQLVVYYSYEGNTVTWQRPSQRLSGADIAKSAWSNRSPPESHRSCSGAVFRQFPRPRAGIAVGTQPEGYQLVISAHRLGGNMAPAVRGWLSEARLRAGALPCLLLPAAAGTDALKRCARSSRL